MCRNLKANPSITCSLFVTMQRKAAPCFRVTKTASTRALFANMNSQFFYVQLNFRPKIGADRVPLIIQHEAVVEISEGTRSAQAIRKHKGEFEREGDRS